MWKCWVSAPALTIGRNGATMAKYRFILDAIIPHSQSNGNAWFDRLTTGGSTGSPQAVRQALRPFDGVYPEQSRGTQGRLGSGQAHHKRFDWLTTGGLAGGSMVHLLVVWLACRYGSHVAGINKTPRIARATVMTSTAINGMDSRLSFGFLSQVWNNQAKVRV